MALIVEDGTGVANADTFATVAEAQAYATKRGLDMPADEADVEPLLIKAMDFIKSVEERFQGVRTFDDQLLPFPRMGVVLFGNHLPDTTIPDILKEAQCRLAFDAQSIDFFPNASGQEVIEEQVGPLKTKYNPTGSSTVQPIPNAALAILEPLTGGGSRFTIPVDR